MKIITNDLWQSEQEKQRLCHILFFEIICSAAYTGKPQRMQPVPAAALDPTKGFPSELK